MTFLVGPKGIPADRVAQVEALFAKTLNSAEHRKFAVDHGLTVTDLRDVQHTFDAVVPKLFTKEK